METSETTVDTYPIRSHDKLRYADTDRQGHVNNAVFATFFETGRTELFNEIRTPGREFVVAKVTVEYLKEVHWPGVVEVGSRIARVGNSSLVIEQGMFKGDELVSRAESVAVQINSDSRRSEPFDDGAREYFTKFDGDAD